MPSYRYLKDIDPESLQPEPPPEYTPQQKRKNWWNYHWKWVVAVLVAAAILAYLMVDVFSKENPDMTIGVLAPYTLPDGLLRQLESELAPLVGDMNGDGKMIVTVMQYTLQTQEQQEDSSAMPMDPNIQMAGVTQLVGAFESGDPVFFIAAGEAADEYQGMYGLFGPADGSLPPEGAGAEAYSTAFGELPGLAALDLTFELMGGGEMDGQEILAGYRVGIRPIRGTRHEDNEKIVAAWAAAWNLLNGLA